MISSIENPRGFLVVVLDMPVSSEDRSIEEYVFLVVRSKQDVLSTMFSLTVWEKTGGNLITCSELIGLLWLLWQCCGSWALRSAYVVKNWEHSGHSRSLSLCVRRCVFRLDRWLKERLHTGHLWGDSSMCRILWTARVRDWQNPFPHSAHLNGFSLLWMYLKQDKAISLTPTS